MVTITQLRAQKKRILAKRDKAVKRQKIEFEKIGLQQEIKKLNRSTSTTKNIKLLKRTGKGFGILSKKIGAAALRQAQRIKAQQLRDNAKFRKSERKNKKKIKTGQNFSKIKEGQGFDVFADLNF